jgi:uncharacterized repeat protein (TIGR03803 family)
MLAGKHNSRSVDVQSSSSFELLYSFKGLNSDGANPHAPPVLFHGWLYGTTEYGGTGSCALGCGSIYAVDLSTGNEKLVYSFTQGNGQKFPVGAYPLQSVTFVRGSLYGTAPFGGTGKALEGDGTIFRLSLSNGAAKAVHNFNNIDGGYPTSELVLVGGFLYGTALGGETGAKNSCPRGCGVTYDIDPQSHQYRVVSQFGSKGGSVPMAGLVFVKGLLYGTTATGGMHGRGTVFQINPKTGLRQIVHSFAGADGADPRATLIFWNGLLYGTTARGGANNSGTVYSLNPSTASERVLLSFNHRNGAQPLGALTPDKGLMYGTTSAGGSEGEGTIFSVNPATGAEIVLHNFVSTDGAMPQAGLTLVNGVLYGTTLIGGQFNNGSVFSIAP